MCLCICADGRAGKKICSGRVKFCAVFYFFLLSCMFHAKPQRLVYSKRLKKSFDWFQWAKWRFINLRKSFNAASSAAKMICQQNQSQLNRQKMLINFKPIVDGLVEQRATKKKFCCCCWLCICGHNQFSRIFPAVKAAKYNWNERWLRWISRDFKTFLGEERFN